MSETWVTFFFFYDMTNIDLKDAPIDDQQVYPPISKHFDFQNICAQNC